MMITLEHFINNSADYPTIDKELQTLTDGQKNFLLNKLHILHKNKDRNLSSIFIFYIVSEVSSSGATIAMISAYTASQVSSVA